MAELGASPGHALEVAVKRKNRRDLEDCRRQGTTFIPPAVETRKLEASLARQPWQEEKDAGSHLFQRLSMLLVRKICADINSQE